MMNACQFLRHRGSWVVVSAALTAVAGLAACGLSSAMGEANSLIIVADNALWEEVEEDTYAALERTVYTTRNEKMFNVTQTDPASPEISQLLLWRQILVFGTPDDPRVRMIAEKVDRTSVELRLSTGQESRVVEQGFCQIPPRAFTRCLEQGAAG